MTVIPLRWWLVLAAILYIMPARVQAEAIAKASAGNIAVTLYSEPCAMKEVVTNLPKRATWDEAGKHFEGCWGYNDAGIVMTYFNDKTVV